MFAAALDPGDRNARRWGWLVIALVVLVVYWPLSTFQYTVGGGDMLDCWLPWRWFISLSLNNGQLPAWNALQQMGYPIYADLQGPAWYVEAIALGGTVGHSILTLQALYLTYIIIGGIGLMRLVRVVHGDARVGLIAGCAYALSGFFTGHQMHFYAVISGAWLPWLIAAQLQLMRDPTWRRALQAAVFQGLLLTGGNHTFTIISAYLFLSLMIVFCVRRWREGDRGYIKRLALHQGLFAITTAMIACGTLFAWWEVHPFLDRASGLSYDTASGGAFTWPAFRSLLTPFALPTDRAVLGTDITMANGFMGAVILVFALLAIGRARSVEENVLAVFGIFCGVVALGDQTPLYHFLWKYLPGINVFRFPSYFLWFTLIAVLVLATGSMRSAAVWKIQWQRWLLVPAGVIILALLVQLANAWMLPHGIDLQKPAVSWFEVFRNMPLPRRAILCTAVTLPVLIILIRQAWLGRLNTTVLFVLVLIEMAWQTQLAQWNTAISDVHPMAIHTRLEQQPKGPVLPELTPMGQNTDGSDELHYLWRNTQDLRGHPTHAGFNSFWLKDANRLETNYPNLWNAMKRQPLLYLSDRIVTRHYLERMRIDPSKDSALVAVLPRVDLPPHKGPRSSTDQVELTMFNYNGMRARVRTMNPMFLMVQQSYYPGWQIRVDGERKSLWEANLAAFGVEVPSGEHDVEIVFEKPILPWLMGLSMITLFSVLVLLALGLSGTEKWIALAGALALAGLVARSLSHSGTVKESSARPIEKGEVLHVDPAERMLTKENPYTAAFRIPVDSLLREDACSLVLDVHYRSSKAPQAGFVIERKRGGETYSYEAIPLKPQVVDTEGWTKAEVILDLREFRYRDEEAGFYIWNRSADTLWVKNERVSVSSSSVLGE